MQRFEEVLLAAREQGASTLSFAGEAIDISDASAVEQQLVRVRQALQKPVVTDVEDATDVIIEGPKEKVGVILKDADEINSALLQPGQPSQPFQRA